MYIKIQISLIISIIMLLANTILSAELKIQTVWEDEYPFENYDENSMFMPL